MKKTIYVLLLFTIILSIIIFSNEIADSIQLSFNICINNVFPSFIPFIILSKLLISYNFDYELGIIFQNLMKKFKVSKNCSIVFIMSLFSGTPSNAIYINNLLENKLIDVKDAKKCLNFCHFVNPIFIINTIGITFLNNKSLGLKILIAHYISSIIIGLFTKKDNINIEKTIIKKSNNRNFIMILKESIIETANNLLLILGIITFFIIITTIINNILNIHENYKFVYGLIEITQGLKYISLSNFSINFKTIISTFLISFGGYSIHMQVFSILDNKKIRYIPYFISRLIHGLLSAAIITILLYL